jgi:hypothetical protein
VADFGWREKSHKTFDIIISTKSVFYTFQFWGVWREVARQPPFGAPLVQHPIMNRVPHTNSHVFHFTRHNQDLRILQICLEYKARELDGHLQNKNMHYTKPYSEDNDYNIIINYGGRMGKDTQCNLNITSIYRTCKNVDSNGSLYILVCMCVCVKTQSWSRPLMSLCITLWHHRLKIVW